MSEIVLPEFIESQIPTFIKQKTIRVEEYDIHYMESGQGTPVFLMHGNPTWSFLYRKVIAALDPNQYRCIAPDLVGLGFSTKPTNGSFHTLENHQRIMSKLIAALIKEDFIFVGQDWGGPIGLLASINHSSKIKGMVLMNTSVFPPKPNFKPTAFHKFSHRPLLSDFVFRVLKFPQSSLHKVQGNAASIKGKVAKAYTYPLRKIRYNKAPLMLARMVPNSLDHASIPFLEKTKAFAAQYTGPVALVWGKKDPILGRLASAHQELMPHATLQLTDGGHFIQEEHPELIAKAIVEVNTK